MSIIFQNNAISKAQQSGTPRDTVYPWGKGVCKHKTGDCRLRRLTGQKRSNRGPHGILCTRGEKEHTSKRLSIIAPDNAISKTKHTTCVRLVDNLHNNKYNILYSQAMRNKSSAGRHQERKPFGCKVFWINAGSAVLSLTGGNARACAQTLLRYP